MPLADQPLCQSQLLLLIFVAHTNMPKGGSEMLDLQRESVKERERKGTRLFRWRLPYASLMQMRHCHRCCCCCCYCCSAAGWPILINCKSLLVTRACLGIRASPVHQSTIPVAQDQDRPESHGNTSAASGFSFLFLRPRELITRMWVTSFITRVCCRVNWF